MNLVVRILFLCFFSLAALPPAAGAADKSLPAITKVKPFHLHEDQDLSADDPMIPFERRYLLWGAVSGEERRARYGHYYSIFWRAPNQTSAVSLRFEYRQVNTGTKVNVKDIEIGEIKKKNVTTLALIGAPYFEDGRITAWRASLISDGAVLATNQSFLWD